MLKLAFCIANVSCTHSSLVCVFIKSFILCLVVFGLLMQEYDMAIVCYIVTIHQLLDKNAFFWEGGNQNTQFEPIKLVITKTV